MNDKEKTTLSIMDQMVKDDNQGIMLSKTITGVNFVPQGAIIGFGISSELGEEALKAFALGTSEFFFMCFAVKKSEVEKYRKQ